MCVYECAVCLFSARFYWFQTFDLVPHVSGFSRSAECIVGCISAFLFFLFQINSGPQPRRKHKSSAEPGRKEEVGCERERRMSQEEERRATGSPAATALHCFQLGGD